MTNVQRRTKSEAKGDKSATALRLVALLVLGGLVGWGSGSLLRLSGVTSGEASLSPWLLIPGLVLSLLFVLAFHEAGHVVGGKLVGFRFVLFIAGPFKLHSTEGGVRLGLNRSLAMAGGLGGAVPTDSRNLTRRMAVYVAGGPSASLLLALAAFGLLSLAPPSVELLPSTVAAASFFVGVVTLIPNRTGGFVSDGARIRMLLRGGPEAERWCAIAALSGMSMAGVRPRDWDGEMIGKSLSPADGSFDDAGASSLAHCHALDRGEVDEAEALLERALAAENVPEVLRSQILLEAAFLRAHLRDDPDGARALLAEAKPRKVMEKSLPLRAEAAISLAEGDVEGAGAKAREGLEALRASLDAGAAKLKREWLEGFLEGRERAVCLREPDRSGTEGGMR